MTNFKHLTKIELSEFSNGSLETNESNDVGRHLLNCADCRERLPMPSVERFWSAVMTESEIEEDNYSEKADYSLLSALSFIPRFFKQPNGWALSCCALFLVICFSALLWLNKDDSAREISQTFEIENPAPDINQEFPIPVLNSRTESESPGRGSNPVVTVPTPKMPQINSAKTNLKSSADKDLKPSFDDKNSSGKNISSTRGVLPKCENGQDFETETVSDNEKIILKWKKIPNAAQYHLFVSDENEILIDEFESAEATSYALRNPLDSGKVYRWKIVVTLENGETVVGEAQEITVKNYIYKRSKSGQVRNSAVRCSIK